MRVVGRPQVLGGGRAVGQRLRGAEREQHAGPPLRRRRLVERAAQVGDGGVGRAAPHRGAPGRLEQVDDAAVAAPRRLEQLRRDLLGGRAGVAQQPRRPLVQQRALARRQLVVDRVAHERVDEPERRVGPQDLRAGERARRGRDGRLVEAGQRRDRGQLGALAEHADGARDGGGVAGQPRRAGRARCSRRRAGRRRGPRRAASRRAPRPRPRAPAASWRSSSGLPPVASWQAAQNASSAPAPSRARTSAAAPGALSGPGWSVSAAGSCDDLGQQRRVGARLARPDGGGDQDRQPLQPPGEIGEEAQRRAVAPVQVVDREQQRPLAGEVGGEPEQAVERGERRDARLVGVGRAEHRRGGRGGTGERGRAALRIGGEPLEQLPDDAEAELALELASARGQDVERVAGIGAQLGEQPGLADPGRAADHHQPPAAVRGRPRRPRRAPRSRRRAPAAPLMRHRARQAGRGGSARRACGRRWRGGPRRSWG